MVQLFLNSIEGRYKLLGTEPLLADWFTGVLRASRSEQLAYVHMGFGSVYAEAQDIHVERRCHGYTRAYQSPHDSNETASEEVGTV
jgi:hypothetical protein